jgi:hypothetical protein
VKSNGDAVMGAGVALEATRRYPGIAQILGAQIGEHGNHVTVIASDPRRPIVIAFPTKHHWRDDADVELVHRSCGELVALLERRYRPGFTCLLPRPGVGLGRLDWTTVVRPILASAFADTTASITVVSR